MKTKTAKFRIESIKIEHKPDENPDLSWLGEYHSELNEKSNEFTIDRKERGDQEHGTYRYFTPGSVEAFDESASWLPAELKTAPKKRQYWFRAMTENAEADYKRAEAYNRAQWSMLGIIAKAVVVSPQGIIQTLRSGGLWGVENDSDAEHLKSIEDEQLSELRAELEAIGVGSRAITLAIRNRL